ncbi:MAG: hypothetical protein RL088_4171 [Verrucomicrobiota bacterium]|jgi:hypothetical protein
MRRRIFARRLRRLRRLRMRRCAEGPSSQCPRPRSVSEDQSAESAQSAGKTFQESRGAALPKVIRGFSRSDFADTGDVETWGRSVFAKGARLLCSENTTTKAADCFGNSPCCVPEVGNATADIQMPTSEFGSASLNVQLDTPEFGSASLNIQLDTSAPGSASLNVQLDTPEFGSASLNVQLDTSESGSASLNVQLDTSEFGSASLNVQLDTSGLGGGELRILIQASGAGMVNFSQKTPAFS